MMTDFGMMSWSWESWNYAVSLTWDQLNANMELSLYQHMPGAMDRFKENGGPGSCVWFPRLVPKIDRPALTHSFFFRIHLHTSLSSTTHCLFKVFSRTETALARSNRMGFCLFLVHATLSLLETHAWSEAWAGLAPPLWFRTLWRLEWFIIG
jgi:hypothetical protein